MVISPSNARSSYLSHLQTTAPNYLVLFLKQRNKHSLTHSHISHTSPSTLVRDSLAISHLCHFSNDLFMLSCGLGTEKCSQCFPLPGRWQHLPLPPQVATSQEWCNDFRSSGFAHHTPKLPSIYPASYRSFLPALLTRPHKFPAQSHREFACSLKIPSKWF